MVCKYSKALRSDNEMTKASQSYDSQIEFLIKFIVVGIETVSCCAGYIGNNIPLFSQKGIGEGRFSHIGLTHDGEFWNFLFLFVFICVLLAESLVRLGRAAQ